MTPHEVLPTDPGDFSFCLGNILPVYDYQKYQLLKITSAKERLLLLNSWIRLEVAMPNGRRNRCDLM